MISYTYDCKTSDMKGKYKMQYSFNPSENYLTLAYVNSPVFPKGIFIEAELSKKNNGLVNLKRHYITCKEYLLQRRIY